MKNLKKCNEKDLNKSIENLPTTQQHIVKACFKQCSTKSPFGMRYSNDYIYQCILMKIKGPALYRKMRRENILPLPSHTTLQNYMQNLKPSYGFQENVFDILEEKVKQLDVKERHGKNNYFKFLNNFINLCYAALR